jgi:xylan 1,4-beta-xylosidase
LWNLVDPDKTGGTKNFRLTINGVRSDAVAKVSRVDDDHGNALAAYKALGSPRYPTQEQVERINAATTLGAPAQVRLEKNRMNLSLQRNALVLVEVDTRS